MSGIAGVFALAGGGETTTQIKAMTARLERRGPEGTRTLIDRDIAFGHTLLATTPEAKVEQLPFVHKESGCAITADARIDNREELMSALDLRGATRAIGDGELILRAYLKWGEACPERLLGDFAFAIWDPRSARLICARDHVGMRQLIYHHEPGRRFLFASEVAAILDVPGVEAPLNEDRISDYLSNMEGADFHSTFFRSIFRLPPAHLLIVDASGLTMRRYWELTPEPLLSLPSDEAYAEAFLTIFREAVRCRLRNAGSIGATLSGGMDSNAVAAIATEIRTESGEGPLSTFSAIGPDPENCIETRAILTAVQRPGIAPTTICYSKLEALRERLREGSTSASEPFDSDITLLRAVYLAARDAGVTVMLDGATSDAVLMSSFHGAYLLKEGRWRDALRESKGERDFWGPQLPTWRAFLASAWQGLAPFALRAVRFRKGRREANRHFHERVREIAPCLDVMKADKRRARVQQRDLENDRVDNLSRMRMITHPNMVVGRERYDRVASACGIEPRDPFCDVRVIRFCLSLPREQLQRNGWPKWLLRNAMADYLAPELIWRRGKQHLGHAFTRSIGDEVIASFDNGKTNAIYEKFNETIDYLYLTTWFAYIKRNGWGGEGPRGDMQ